MTATRFVWAAIRATTAANFRRPLQGFPKISQGLGLHGDYRFADSLQEARLMIITGQGYLPVDVIGEQMWFDSAVKRIPLVRRGEPVTKTYCVFWKKDNSGYYIEEFAEMLKEEFA